MLARRPRRLAPRTTLRCRAQPQLHRGDRRSVHHNAAPCSPTTAKKVELAHSIQVELLDPHGPFSDLAGSPPTLRWTARQQDYNTRPSAHALNMATPAEWFAAVAVEQRATLKFAAAQRAHHHRTRLLPAAVSIPAKTDGILTVSRHDARAEIAVVSTEHLKGSTENLKKTGISPALASFTTGASTTILTIAATLVSLRSDASRESLFLVLSWTLYASAACAAVVVGWILLDAIRRNLGELRHLSELEAHVPRLIRFRRRSDRVQILIDGDALVQQEFEIESAPGAAVPWVTFPILWGADPDGPEWQSFSIRKVSVDGVDFDPARALTKKARSRILNNPRFEQVVLEEGAVRVPISLEPNRRRCTVVIEVEAPRAYASIVSATLEEDSYLTALLFPRRLSGTRKST